MATTVTLKPNAIDLSGSTSGTTTLQATAVAGTTTITLPAATDTLVGKATTDTLTNKTLTSPTLTTPVLGTPSSGTLTNCTGLPNAGLVNSSVTIGGTAIALGASSSTITNDLSISGLTVGKGGGAVSTNTAVGASALNTNGAGANNTAFGYQAGYSNVTGNFNTYVGSRGPGYNATGDQNAFFGDYSGRSVTTGAQNTFLGQSSGSGMTTGSKNTIIGGFGGNQNSIDIRTASNNCIVSDGDGNPQIHSNSSSWVSTPWGSIDVTQGAGGAGTANSFGITSGTATPIFGGVNSFSGAFIINEFSQTGACALVMTAGGGGSGITIVSQVPSTTFVVTSSPTSGQIGVYLSGSVVVIKPGIPGTTNYRIIAFRTRGSQ